MYLSLALVVPLCEQVFTIQGAAMTVNYGVNWVRFPGPVPTGSRIRVRLTLAGADTLPDAGIQLTWSAVIEREESGKPACVVKSLTRVHFEEPAK